MKCIIISMFGMREDVEVDLDEPASIIHQDHPNSSSHAHESKGTTSKCTLQIHMSNINHAQYMNIVDPFNVLVIATNST
jgi:hypothetical protein